MVVSLMIRILIVLQLGLAFIGSSALLANKSVEAQVPPERPRVYRGPYNDTVIRSHYYSSPIFGYSSYYYPFYSPLMMMGPIIPGRTSVTFAAGSNGYMGAGFTTSDRIKGTNLIYSLSSSWEKGEGWYSGYDYKRSSISPSIQWSNETTSLFLGFDFSELTLEDTRVLQKPRPRVDRGYSRPGIPLGGELNSVMEFNSAHVGLTHSLGDHAQLFISVSEDDWGKDPFFPGMRGRLYESNSGRNRWATPISGR